MPGARQARPFRSTPSARPILLGKPRGFFDSRRRVIKRPSIVSLLLALIPFVGMCFSVALWDRVTPRVFGLPFNMFWPLAWLFLLPAVMSLIYRLEKKR
jgi:hypothetical protein